MQFKTWAPDLNVICYIGSGVARRVIREYEFGPPKKLKLTVLLTTYEYILKDKSELGGIKWQALMVDEVCRSGLSLRLAKSVPGTPAEE